MGFAPVLGSCSLACDLTAMPWQGDTCTPTIIGANMDVQAHDLKNDLLQLMEGIADLRDCAAACCADSR